MYEELLSKEELTRLKRAFALFDVDGDGTISTKVINFFKDTKVSVCQMFFAAYSFFLNLYLIFHFGANHAALIFLIKRNWQM